MIQDLTKDCRLLERAQYSEICRKVGLEHERDIDLTIRYQSFCGKLQHQKQGELVAIK